MPCHALAAIRIKRRSQADAQFTRKPGRFLFVVSPWVCRPDRVQCGHRIVPGTGARRVPAAGISGLTIRVTRNLGLAIYQ